MSTEETSVILNICDAYIKSGRTSNFVMSFNKNVDLWLHSTNEELFLFDKRFNVRCLFDIKALKKFVEDYPGISILHINNKKISLIDYHLETKMDQNNCPVIQIIIESFEPDYTSTGPDFATSLDFLNANPTSKLFFIKICSQNQSRLSNSPEHKIMEAAPTSNEVILHPPESPKSNTNVDPANIQSPNLQSASKIKLKYQTLNDLKEMLIQIYKEKNITQLPLETTIPKNRFVQNPETGLLESPQISKVKKVKEQKNPKPPKDPNAPKQPRVPRKPKVIDPNMPPKEKKVRIKKEKKEEKVSKEVKEIKVIKDSKEIKEVKNFNAVDQKLPAPIIQKDAKLSGIQQTKSEGVDMKNFIPQKLPSVQFNPHNMNFDPNKIEVKESQTKLLPADIPQLVGRRGLQEAPVPELEPSLKRQKIN